MEVFAMLLTILLVYNLISHHTSCLPNPTTKVEMLFRTILLSGILPLHSLAVVADPPTPSLGPVCAADNIGETCMTIKGRGEIDRANITVDLEEKKGGAGGGGHGGGGHGGARPGAGGHSGGGKGEGSSLAVSSALILGSSVAAIVATLML